MKRFAILALVAASSAALALAVWRPASSESGGSSAPAPIAEVQPAPAPQFQAIPAPPGIPPSFRIQFTTSVGETIDTRANFIGISPGQLAYTGSGLQQTNFGSEMAWRSPPVRHSIDHQILSSQINEPIELHVSLLGGGCYLRIGTYAAEVLLNNGRPSAFGFDLPASPFRYRSITYSNFVVTP